MSLPTALDVAKHVQEEQERCHEAAKDKLYNAGGKEFFYAVSDTKGRFKLAPGPEFNPWVFRGQTKFYDPCQPTLFRGKLTAVERFLERLRVVQFEHILKDHPAVVECSNINIMGDFFNVAFDALSQHYGFKTDLLDFTSDPYIAAFFASTIFNSKSGSFEPALPTNECGVFYQLNLAFDIDASNLSRADFVGLQPLKRPGDQLAFSYRMGRKENLNKAPFVYIYRFRHDKTLSEWLLSRFDGGKLLLPPDPAADKAASIKATKVFEKEAFMDAAQRYWGKSGTGSLLNKLKKYNISMTEDRFLSFTSSEHENLEADWNSRRERFFSLIRWRLAADSQALE